MPALLLIPFAAFTGCVLAQFYMLRQVRRILANNHPDVWLSLSSKALFLDNAVISFVLRGKDRALHDAELLKTTRRMRRLQAVALIIWIIYAVVLASGLGFTRP